MKPFRPRFRRKRDHFFKYDAPVRATAKDMQRYRSCGHKIRHPSLVTAEVHARTVVPRPGRTLEAYRCKFCRFWHVGHARTKTS